MVMPFNPRMNTMKSFAKNGRGIDFLKPHSLKEINMKSLYTAFALALFLNASAHADGAMHNMPGMKDHAMPSATEKTQDAQTHRGQGTVNAVDVAAGKLNLTHESIASLGWKSMTMDFSVQNPTLLKNLKPGAQVEFELQKSGGAYLITRIAALEQAARKSNDHVDDPARPHTH